jgi:hypothetical protein
MNVNFTILSAFTVPQNYTWDLEVPFNSSNSLTSAFVNTNYVSGYCPSLMISLSNISIPDPFYDNQQFIWHFGDYYSKTISISSTVLSSAEHTFIMPGKYNVSLTLIQNTTIPGVKTINETITKFGLVELKEIPPVARMHSVTQPITGNTPLTLEFTPEFCSVGSFPIDQIDWNFGDGSSIKTITRYFSPTADPEVIFTNRYYNDPKDVRNFNIKHTFIRTSKNLGMFYPSLTCYSASTNTSDACSITIGPVLRPDNPSSINILKVKNTIYGNIYTINPDNQITFLTESSSTPILENIPQNPIRSSFGMPTTMYTGNSGN